VEPKPENVTGEKVQKHVFKHRVDWGHVALGLGVIAVAWVAYQTLAESSPKNEEPSLGTEV
jgi:hypothetical protein